MSYTAQGTAWERKKSPKGQREPRGGWRVWRPGVCASIRRGVWQGLVEDETQSQTPHQTKHREQQRKAHHKTQFLRQLHTFRPPLVKQRHYTRVWTELYSIQDWSVNRRMALLLCLYLISRRSLTPFSSANVFFHLTDFLFNIMTVFVCKGSSFLPRTEWTERAAHFISL